MMLWLDLETYCTVPINHGTYRYAASAEVMLFSYAFDDDPVQVWDVTTGAPMPADLHTALHDPAVLRTAHNAMFDRTVLMHACDVDVPVESWRCTMTHALAHALPGGLAELCAVLRVPQDQAKHDSGRRLVHLFCKPRKFAHRVPTAYGSLKARKAEIERLRAQWKGRATRETHPAEWQEFLGYAKADTEAMRAVHRKLPNWNFSGDELALWHLDQRINDRGFAVDQELSQGAVDACARAKKDLATRTQELTLYDGIEEGVESTTKRDQTLRYILQEHGVGLPDMQKSTLERFINDSELPEAVRELLRIRLQASATSTSKYTAVMRGVSTDGRLRGTLQFCGASRTGRWAGRCFQPHNLPRTTGPAGEVAFRIEALRAGCAEQFYDNIHALASQSVRGVLVAAPGRKLVVSDFKNIEGRAVAWLADEQWLLDAYRAFDAEPHIKALDLYNMMYMRTFSVPIEAVGTHERQIGKVISLFSAFEGGVGAYVTGAATYGIDLDAMALASRPSIPDDVWEEAKEFLDWAIKTGRPTYGLSDFTYCVCESLKRMARRAQPKITKFWPRLKGIARAAITMPGNDFSCGRLIFRRDAAWLRMILPSGRSLCYPGAQVDDAGVISYLGKDQYTRQWKRLTTYGGKLFENAAQGLARDVMAYSMVRAENAGFPIVLTVHDELVTEVDADFHKNLDTYLSAPISWALGLPLAAHGFTATRYRKD